MVASPHATGNDESPIRRSDAAAAESSVRLMGEDESAPAVPREWRGALRQSVSGLDRGGGAVDYCVFSGRGLFVSDLAVHGDSARDR